MKSTLHPQSSKRNMLWSQTSAPAPGRGGRWCGGPNMQLITQPPLSILWPAPRLNPTNKQPKDISCLIYLTYSIDCPLIQSLQADLEEKTLTVHGVISRFETSLRHEVPLTGHILGEDPPERSTSCFVVMLWVTTWLTESSPQPGCSCKLTARCG